MHLPPPPPPPQPIYKRIFPNWVIGVLVVAFIAAVLLTGYLAFSVVRSAVFSLRPEIKSPEIAQSDTNITPQDIANLINIETPLQAENGPPPEYWDGLSRVNILFIGVDHREWMVSQGPPLADTLILATYDPQSQSVGMLSIPRDLYLFIPGQGENRINTAHIFGELERPGGGPERTPDRSARFTR